MHRGSELRDQGKTMEFSEEVSNAIHFGEEAAKLHAQSLGFVAIQWGHLDVAVSKMFEPLLDCSEMQVACILVENIASRCEMLKKLLHVEDLPPDWLGWVVGLLDRSANELAPQRNRLMHDLWWFESGTAVRTDQRAKVARTQSFQNATLSYNTKHLVTNDEIMRLHGRIYTVFTAICVANINLHRWRSKLLLPELDKQWYPACTSKSRCLNF